MLNYTQERKRFYEKLPEFWADMYGQEYALYTPYPIESTEKESVKEFGTKASHILFKTASLLQSPEIKDETLQLLGFPDSLVAFLRFQSPLPKTVIGRIDSIETPDGHKVMEFNSDTPTFIYECFKVNELLCEHFRKINPNAGMEKDLRHAIRTSLLSSYRGLGTSHSPNIAFTSHGENMEDKQTVLYLQKLCGFPSQYIPLEELIIQKNEGLYDQNGKKIDVLYRQTFPIELLIQDKDLETNEQIGLQLTDLVIQNKLAIVNPPSAFLLQSKAVLALIWGLYEERSPYFTSQEHEWISQYFLPTYLEPDPFLSKKERYVQKPVFGREGDTVRIFDGNGNIVDQDKNATYEQYASVYQKYVPLPKMKFECERGNMEGHRMTGTFIINGKPSAFGYRVGNPITDNLSYFLPSCLQN
ncbi:glutathionylspermidine synthase family protein [Fictibacillus nanhaiensis]|uniref:glutathionylspermidine synthase family protein n=1 Tax=Fictibacillus nanhaiensis TaxID=742169 RepID=UPI001C98675A|nr:glutathionylspermidine synthase family protein [Fictibacillus nanhaiensis]MBY6035387.1 glutathionylspermidine synthase family protein [Fictibacillus nanhaiensis]